MKQTGMVTTTLDYKVSSGLSRPDFFDWPAHFAQQIPAVNPDIVIVTFGGNDAQGLRNVDKTWAVQHVPGAGGDDANWRTEYGKRVGAAMDYLGGDNRTLIWVGIPNDDEPVNTARLQVQNEVVMAEAAKRPKVVFIDTWNRFSGLSGGYASTRAGSTRPRVQRGAPQRRLPPQRNRRRNPGARHRRSHSHRGSEPTAATSNRSARDRPPGHRTPGFCILTLEARYGISGCTGYFVDLTRKRAGNTRTGWGDGRRG